MESVVLQLQRECLDSRVPILDILRKALVVARKDERPPCAATRLQTTFQLAVLLRDFHPLRVRVAALRRYGHIPAACKAPLGVDGRSRSEERRVGNGRR